MYCSKGSLRQLFPALRFCILKTLRPFSSLLSVFVVILSFLFRFFCFLLPKCLFPRAWVLVAHPHTTLSSLYQAPNNAFCACMALSMNWVLLEKRRTIGLGFGIKYTLIFYIISLIFKCFFFLNSFVSMYKQRTLINILFNCQLYPPPHIMFLFNLMESICIVAE